MLSPTYPLYSDAAPWEEMAVLHPPASPRHDDYDWMMHEGLDACNFARYRLF